VKKVSDQLKTLQKTAATSTAKPEKARLDSEAAALTK